MCKTNFRGEILQRSAQSDRPAVGTNVERKEMANPLARGTNIALLNAGAEPHYLMGKHFGESLSSFRIHFKGRQQFSLGKKAHGGIGIGYRITMVLSRIKRSLCKCFAWPRHVQYNFTSSTIDSAEPHAAGNYFVHADSFAAEPKQCLVCLQFSIDGRSADFDREPVLDRHLENPKEPENIRLIGQNVPDHLTPERYRKLAERLLPRVVEFLRS